MPESQIIEYKQSWRDDYLKWICGFANAQGGTLYIGMDDSGNVVGVKNAKKLSEDIPNQIQSILGIMADVNKRAKEGKEYIEIIVSPSSYPVNYHGEYHYRSGSTKQQLTGVALTQFILQKTGFHWEDVTVDDVKIEDLDDESFKIFKREALRSNRMTAEELNISNEELLEKLHLMSGGKLKRSAVLLFHHDPSIVQVGSIVKIGRFGEGADLQYQHTLEGSLISNADKVIDLIYLMYLKAKITYEHYVRVETYPYARDAIREAVFNAMVHNCYMYGVPVQIRIEDKQMIISNQCILPEDWTVDTFMKPHDSRPYNPEIANVFYRAGYIEQWGRGIQKICDACKSLGTEMPKFQLVGNSLRVFFPALESALIDASNPPKRQSGGLSGTLAERIADSIRNDKEITIEGISNAIGIPKRTIEREMKRMQEAGQLRREGGKKQGHWEVIE